MRAAIGIFIALLVVGAIAFAVAGLKPPDRLRMATGLEGGGYWRIGLLYQEALARDGLEVELLETAGAVENLERLAAGEVDVALVQGGLTLSQEDGLQSLGAIFLEPIAIFRNSASEIVTNPGAWKDFRIAAGPVGSGTRAAALALIAAAEIDDDGLELVEAGGFDALAAVREGRADAALFVSPLAAPYLMEAIFDPEFVLVPMSLIDALSLRIPGAIATTVAAGAISLEPPRPPAPVRLLALKASLLATQELHPALVDRLVTAAMELHGNRDILHGYREFPSVDSPPVPINEAARQLILTGPGLLHDIFPFWIAAQFGSVLLLALPVLFLAPPILRAIPSGYVWFQKRRIWRNYQRIALLEEEVAGATSPEDLAAVSRQLDELDVFLANLKLPLAYRQGAYDARMHIDLIRQDIARRSA